MGFFSAKKTVPKWQFFAALLAGATLCFIIGISVYFGKKCPARPPPSPASTPVPPPTHTTVTPIDYSTYYLPKALVPSFYKLDLKTFMPSNAVAIQPSDLFKFQGNISIHFSCVTATNKIVLSWNKLNLSSTLLSDQSGNQIAVTSNQWMVPQQMMRFNLASGLSPGVNYTFSINFWAYLNDDLVGFYRSSYMEGGKLQWLAVTQMEPTDARTAFPCFDEPAFKASFQISMTYPNTYNALSNAADVTNTDLGGGWKKTQFDKTLKMSSYLVAYAIVDFEHTSMYTKDNKTQFRIWARRELVNQTWFATTVGPQCLDLYAQYFSVPFPLHKQDMLAVPDFDAGAMENWGLVTYRESRLTYVPNKYPASAMEAVAGTITHELAHQWFGDLVTMRWWNDLFLNEGFADYVEAIGEDKIPIIGGSFRRIDDTVYSDTDTAMEMDQGLSTHPISFNVEPTVGSINSLFDAITYEKGGSVLKMLNYTITKDLFVAGLTNYLNKWANANPTHEDLWKELTLVVQANGSILDWNGQPLNVASLMDPWVLQPGFPVINILRHNKQLILTQQRFLVNPQNTPSTLTWPIPVWYTIQGSQNPIFQWISPSESLTLNAPDPSKWVLVNYNVNGFYRVNYDTANWKLLITQLIAQPNVIPVRNRDQLINDAWNLAKASKVDYSIALGMSLYLRGETNINPWTTSDRVFSFMKQMFGIGANFPDYRNYMASLITPVYRTMGWNDTEADKYVDIHNLRRYAVKVSCDLDLQDCVSNALAQFNQLKKACAASQSGTYNCSPVSPNLREAVYCSGIKHGSVADWMLVWRFYGQEQISAERDNLLRGLSCTREPWLLIKLLNEALAATTIRSQDARYAFQYVGANPIGPSITWSYVSENWNAIREKYANSFGFSINRIVYAATSGFNTDFQMNQLRNFINSNNLGTAVSAFKSQLEKAVGNALWMETHAANIIKWIRLQNFPPAV